MKHWICTVLLSLVLVPLGVNAAEPEFQQEFVLPVGWNLISIQVGDAPIPVETFRSAFVDGEIQQIWGYVPGASASTPGIWNFFRAPALPALSNEITHLEQGKGYWVKVGGARALGMLEGPVWSGSITLKPGWNLVGFPGLSRDESEQQELSSVFGSSFDRIQQLWTFDAIAQGMIGYDQSALPAVEDVKTIESGKGYWVYSIEAADLSLQPEGVLALIQDADASPLQAEEEGFSDSDSRWTGTAAQAALLAQEETVRFAGPEDAEFDLNANGVLDGPFTQDQLLFEVGVDRKVISISNRGVGLFPWSVDDSSIPWLSAEPAAGTVSDETDFITLKVDPTELAPGDNQGVMTVYVDGTPRQVTLTVQVPTSAGDWEGVASTTRVAGRELSIGAVDLNLSLFMLGDSPSETQFRAVLNEDRSLLFPKDVFLNGVFFSGDQFSMTTSFGVPAGDRNAPPFDTFAQPANYNTLTSADRFRADFDANGDGKYEAPFNPFAQEVRRELTLLGQRVGPDRLEGTYIESITGLLPENRPLFVEGSFFLERRSFEPTQRSAFNQDTVDEFSPIIIGSVTGSRQREMVISVDSDVTVDGINVSLNVDFPDPSLLTVLLIAPNNQSVLLHNRGEVLPATFALDDFNGISGQGDWTLRVSWEPTAERGTFNSWGINIEGLATFSIAGTVASDAGGSLPLEDALVILTGSNQIETVSSAADGSFEISGLTENSYSLSVSLPGYETLQIPDPSDEDALPLIVRNADVDLGTVQLIPVSDPDPRLLAKPYIGSQDLWVNFELVLPLSSLAALGDLQEATWDFGDGNSILATADANDEVELNSASYLYTQAGSFSPKVILQGSNGSLEVDVNAKGVQVLRSKADDRLVNGAPQTHQMLVLGMMGALAAPTANGVGPLQLAPGTLHQDKSTQELQIRQTDGSYTQTSVSIASNRVLWQESKADAATFDIDRTPKDAESSFRPNAEDSDFVDRPYIGGDGSNTLPFTSREFDAALDPEQDNTPGLFTLYQAPELAGEEIPDRYRLHIQLGGTAAPVLPAGAGFGRTITVGDFKLQVNRILPR